MDGHAPLVLEEETMLAPASPPETGEWVAVRAGDSAMTIWFPADSP